jgi:hypothetical protein
MDAGRTLQQRLQKEHGETSYDRNGKIHVSSPQFFRLTAIWSAFCHFIRISLLRVGPSCRNALFSLKCS